MAHFSTLAILPERLLFVGKFRWKLPSNGTGIFFGTENRNGIELCHLRNTSFCFLSRWSLALVIQTNGTENLGRFGKNGKQVILLKRYCFFSGKLPPGWTALFFFFFFRGHAWDWIKSADYCEQVEQKSVLKVSSKSPVRKSTTCRHYVSVIIYKLN